MYLNIYLIEEGTLLAFWYGNSQCKMICYDHLQTKEEIWGLNLNVISKISCKIKCSGTESYKQVIIYGNSPKTAWYLVHCEGKYMVSGGGIKKKSNQDCQGSDQVRCLHISSYWMNSLSADGVVWEFAKKGDPVWQLAKKWGKEANWWGGNLLRQLVKGLTSCRL